MKLKIELVPESAFGQNLRNIMPPREWQQLSRYVREMANCKCEICGRQFERIGQLDAHEVWKYKKIKKKSGKIKYVQELKDIQSLCTACHAVKHAGLHISQGSYKYIKKHFCEVNRCSKKEFKKALKKAYEKCYKRGEYKWKLKVTPEYAWALMRKKYGDNNNE